MAVFTRRGVGTLLALGALGAGPLVLAGCSSSAQEQDAGTLRVVTTTNVYADIVKNVAGDGVEVTPIIDSTSQDPHSYEATAQDKLAIQKADVVVLNGGGYDEFMTQSAEGTGATVIDAVSVSGLEGAEEASEAEHTHAEGEEGHHHHHGEFNEHVWYSLPAMQRLTDKVSGVLGDKDGDHAQDYKDRAGDYRQKLEDLEHRAESVKGSGHSYLATEPVPGYLLQETGMTDVTPEEFTEAIEAGDEVPAATLEQVRKKVSGHAVDLVAFNPQTESSQTQMIKTEAQKDGVATADFTETLPEGKDYVGWMGDNVTSISSALTA